MKFHIRTLAGKVLFSIEASNIKEAIEQAVAAKIDLTYADLRKVDLSGANLEGACFDMINFENAIFQGANLKNASFKYTILSRTDFLGANMLGVSFHNAYTYNTLIDLKYLTVLNLEPFQLNGIKWK